MRRRNASRDRQSEHEHRYGHTQIEAELGHHPPHWAALNARPDLGPRPATAGALIYQRTQRRGDGAQVIGQPQHFCRFGPAAGTTSQMRLDPGKAGAVEPVFEQRQKLTARVID
jgi:hypothetical protein